MLHDLFHKGLRLGGGDGELLPGLILGLQHLLNAGIELALKDAGLSIALPVSVDCDGAGFVVKAVAPFELVAKGRPDKGLQGF